jgi:hypothetical protein
MAGGKLSVEIGADITDFEKKIKEVEFDIKELSKVKLDRLKVGLDTSEINAQIKDAKANLNSLKTTVKDTGNQIGGQFTKQVGNGGNTLMQFSRIAQDAPFGIMGIGNNITATAESFSYLKAQTGSTGGALKALASSVMGTGGLLLGVSLLTTGFTLLAQSGLTVGDVIDKLTGDFDEFGATIKSAREEGAKAGAKEVVQMNALIAVAQNEVRSKKDRFNAVAELKKQFPEYYSQLSAEKIMFGDLTKEIQGATRALVAKAIGDKLAGKAADTYGEILLANGRYVEQSNKLKLFDLETEKKVAEARKASADIAQKTERARAAQREDLVDGLKEESASIGRLTKKYEALINITSQIYQAPTPTADAPKSFNTPQVTGIGQTIIPAPLIDLNGVETFNGQIDAFGNKVKELPGVMQTPLMQVSTLVNEALVQYTAIMAEFTNQLNDLIQSSVPNAIANLGSALGEALATGTDVVSALGASLLQSMGGFISELGKMLIQYGLLLVGFGKAQLAFQAGDPITKIGAGIAMIALGVAATAAGAAIGSFASGNGRGGGASSSSGAGANNSSFTSSGFGSGGNSGGTVVFEIAGQKLIGVLSNTINANRRLGGQIGLG